jgi:ABC-type multidrug transport system ATPase subunit
MRESFLKTFTKYCALVSSMFRQENPADAGRKFIKYLREQIKVPELSDLESLFEFNYESYTEEYSLFKEPEFSVAIVDSMFNKITLETVQTISLNDRIILILLLIDYFYTMVSEKKEDLNYLEVVCTRLGMSPAEFNDLCQFVTGKDIQNASTNILVCRPGSTDKTEELEGSWIENNLPVDYKITNEIEIEELTSPINILFLERSKMFVLKCVGDEELMVEGNHTAVCKFKILEPGTTIKINDQSVIRYSDIKHKYLQYKFLTGITLNAENISSKPRKKNKGIKEFSVYETSGILVGILGKEGVGKSTLLELFAGQKTPDTGKILINDYNLKTNRYLLKSVIGYIPEYDLLFDELTVYDNLMLNARLFFSKSPLKELDKKINHLLEKLSLLEYKNTVVGSIYEKNLQPGQRRILNIALELLRTPKILLVDNPYYGLNNVESSRIIKLLHDYTFEGNLVITCISQTNPQAFRMFDKLWIIDESGYPVFTDEAYKASEYFSAILDVKGLEENLGETTPESILELMDFRLTDYSGRWGRRKITPSDWYEHYQAQHENKRKPLQVEKTPLPTGIIKLPNLETQFKIFNIRNFKIKFSNRWKIIYTLLAGPFIAFFLGTILRYSPDGAYVFMDNPNIPLYLFSCSVISLFLGLIISADEIIKERNLLNKEAYLEFSKFSYINSKILYLFLIASIQTLLLTITGNIILGIHGMLLQFWLVLFSTCCFGIILGLNLSIIHRNLYSIYEISIPVILALQIFLGSGIIKYENLNKSKSPYVPIPGELMTVRWAYEAMAVEQFKNNKFEKRLYPFDKKQSIYTYYTYDLVPQLEQYLDKSMQKGLEKDSVGYYLNFIRNGINTIINEPEIFEFEYLDKLNVKDFNNTIALETKDYLTYLEINTYNAHENAIIKKNEYIRFLRDSLGNESYRELKNRNYNTRIANLVMNNDEPLSFKTYKNKIYQLSDPIFQRPKSNFGRAVLFVPEKKFRGEVLDTLWFNITFIWLFSFLLYLILLIYPPAKNRGISF